MSDFLIIKRIRSSYPRIFYNLVLFNLLLDIFSFWSSPGGVTAAARLIVLFFTLLFFLLREKLSIFLSWPIIIFAVYILLQLFFAEDLQYSLKVSLQIILSLLMFFIGYGLINREEDFRIYLNQFFWIYILIIANTILSNLFDVGKDNYTDNTNYMVGGLSDLWNVYTYSLLLLPLLLLYKTRKKFILIGVSLLVFIFLIISLKRIAIGGVFFAIGLYFLLSDKRGKIIKYGIVTASILIISSPLFMDILVSRVDARADKGRFEENFYETEARYLEVLMMERWIDDFRHPEEVLFGLKAFDTRGALSGGERQFHMDYTLILYSIGITGLLMYILIYLNLFRQIGNLSRRIRVFPILKEKYTLHLVTIKIILVTSLVTSIAGQMYHITFRMMIFMSVGAVIKLVSLKVQEEKFKLNNPG